MKKIIKLFCIVSCLMVCFAGCGKGDDKASYNAQDVRAYLETQVADISKGEEEPVDDETATFKKEEGMYKSAVESWNKLADECGKATDSVSDFAINEQNGELAVTEVIQFEDRKVNITSTFEESDNGYIMTSLSFDPIYSMGEKMEQAALNTVMGMGTVFAVLIFISAIISLFKFIPSIIDSFGKNKKSEENKETATESKASVPVVEQPVSDDAELIAVIAAAIAASENTTTDGFVVRSIRKRYILMNYLGGNKMKNYTITVNGNVYDVTVEETGSTPSAAPVRKAAPAAKAAPAPAAAPAASGAEGSVKITAPMPGKVLSISANVGQAVKRGDTVLVFEAMKMENTVVAPEDGTVASISVAVGDSFEAGAVIASLN